MKKHDKLLHKYSIMRSRGNVTANIIYEDKKLRNKVTKLKRDSKVEVIAEKSSAIWKGIRYIVNLKNISRKPQLLNKYFASLAQI